MKIIKNRYEIIKSIGSGGMGEVFLAADLKEGGKIKAVKIIRTDIKDQNLIKHFKNEFRLMTHLHHPNLVQVYDFGFDKINKIYFLVLEYLSGQSLELLKTEQKHPKELISVLVSLLRALEFIHTRNILFRDLKPDNVFYDEATREVKLFDFGLSDFKRAEIYTVKGSVQYLSPEVIHRTKVDKESDIFSFGILMTEIFTGADFYTSEELPAILIIMSSQKSFDEKLKIMLKKIDNSRLRKIIKKCLAYEPADRYRSCAEIIADLNKISEYGNFSVETLFTKLAYIQDCDYFDYSGGLKKSLQFLKKPGVKIIAVLGGSGSGKTRTLREFKFYCQLHNLNIIYDDSLSGKKCKSLIPVLDSIYREAYLDNYTFRYVGHVLRNAINQPITALKGEKTNRFILSASRLIFDYIKHKKEKTVLVLDNLHEYDQISIEIIGQLIILQQNNQEKGSKLCLIVATDQHGSNLKAFSQTSSSDALFRLELPQLSRAQLKKYLQYHLGSNTPKTVLNGLIDILNKFDYTPSLVTRLVQNLFTAGLLNKKSGKWQFAEGY